MRRTVFLAMFVSMAAFGASASADDGHAIQGSWTVLYAEEAGWQMSPDQAAVTMLDIQSSRYVMYSGWQPFAIGKLALGGGWPKQIDLMPLSGPYAGQVYQGIYDITGDVQTVSFATPGTPRPTEFASFPGRSLYVWLRAQRPIGGPLRPMPGQNF